MNQDLGTPTKQLADGFSALCEEYKLLAQQYAIVESKLLAATSECESLRQLLPSNTAPVKVTKEDDFAEITLRPGRNLGEWLAQMYEKSGPRDARSLATISDAEFACFKIRSNLVGDRRHGPRSGRASSASNRPPPRAGSLQQSRPLSPIPMEQDFTVEGEKGQLRCPFVSLGQVKIFDPTTSTIQSHDIPTPRGSDSHLTVNGRRSKRASFVDPIKPQIILDKPASPAQSEASGGPACPIRFLGQHSPEEVAKYFEDHKHELPRSHEVCVKRFQANADSIRELDAKYGNLVTMIQGLGQKHQPMLPEVPNLDDAANVSEEQKSIRRVKKWATAVSECAPVDATGIDPNVDESPSMIADDGEDEERLQRFDRDLQEVRLGESPSRPWGVTIPSKIPSRREGSTVCSSSAAAAVVLPKPSKPTRESYTSPDMHPPARDEEAPSSLPAHPSNAQGESQTPTGKKCPFDHSALGEAMRAKPHDPLPPSATRTHTNTNTTPPSVTKKEATEPSKPHSQTQSHTQSQPQSHHSYRSGPKIINHGTAFMADAGGPFYTEFENHGTLIMGYDDEQVKRMLRALRRQSV